MRGQPALCLGLRLRLLGRIHFLTRSGWWLLLHDALLGRLELDLRLFLVKSHDWGHRLRLVDPLGLLLGFGWNCWQVGGRFQNYLFQRLSDLVNDRLLRGCLLLLLRCFSNRGLHFWRSWRLLNNRLLLFWLLLGLRGLLRRLSDSYSLWRLSDLDLSAALSL